MVRHGRWRWSSTIALLYFLSVLFKPSLSIALIPPGFPFVQFGLTLPFAASALERDSTTAAAALLVGGLAQLRPARCHLQLNHHHSRVRGKALVLPRLSVSVFGTLVRRSSRGRRLDRVRELLCSYVRFRRKEYGWKKRGIQGGCM